MSLNHWQADFIKRGTRRSYFEGGDTKEWGVPAGTAPPCNALGYISIPRGMLMFRLGKGVGKGFPALA